MKENQTALWMDHFLTRSVISIRCIRMNDLLRGRTLWARRSLSWYRRLRRRSDLQLSYWSVSSLPCISCWPFEGDGVAATATAAKEQFFDEGVERCCGSLWPPFPKRVAALHAAHVSQSQIHIATVAMYPSWPIDGIRSQYSVHIVGYDTCLIT